MALLFKPAPLLRIVAAVATCDASAVAIVCRVVCSAGSLEINASALGSKACVVPCVLAPTISGGGEMIIGFGAHVVPVLAVGLGNVAREAHLVVLASATSGAASIKIDICELDFRN